MSRSTPCPRGSPTGVGDAGGHAAAPPGSGRRVPGPSRSRRRCRPARPSGSRGGRSGALSEGRPRSATPWSGGTGRRRRAQPPRRTRRVPPQPGRGPPPPPAAAAARHSRSPWHRTPRVGARRPRGARRRSGPGPPPRGSARGRHDRAGPDRPSPAWRRRARARRAIPRGPQPTHAAATAGVRCDRRTPRGRRRPIRAFVPSAGCRHPPGRRLLGPGRETTPHWRARRSARVMGMPRWSARRSRGRHRRADDLWTNVRARSEAERRVRREPVRRAARPAPSARGGPPAPAARRASTSAARRHFAGSTIRGSPLHDRAVKKKSIRSSIGSSWRVRCIDVTNSSSRSVTPISSSASRSRRVVRRLAPLDVTGRGRRPVLVHVAGVLPQLEQHLGAWLAVAQQEDVGRRDDDEAIRDDPQPMSSFLPSSESSASLAFSAPRSTLSPCLPPVFSSTRSAALSTPSEILSPCVSRRRRSACPWRRRGNP